MKLLCYGIFILASFFVFNKVAEPVFFAEINVAKDSLNLLRMRGVTDSQACMRDVFGDSWQNIQSQALDDVYNEKNLSGRQINGTMSINEAFDIIALQCKKYSP